MLQEFRWIIDNEKWMDQYDSVKHFFDGMINSKEFLKILPCFTCFLIFDLVVASCISFWIISYETRRKGI